MFRSDRDALAQQVEDLRLERESLRAQNEAMRADILARRQGLPPGSLGSVYKREIARLTPGERTALARHGAASFPTWLALLLHFLTFGIFSLAHFSALHGRLPKAEQDDPSYARAFWFTFIPYFGIYWVVFNTARLVDRINLQFRLRGLPDRVPRTFLIATAVVTVIPYINVLFAFTLLWPVAIFFLQRAVNELATLPGDVPPPAVAAADTAVAPFAPPARVRVPLVKDLPGPDDMVEQQAEAEAQDALRPRRATR